MRTLGLMLGMVALTCLGSVPSQEPPRATPAAAPVVAAPKSDLDKLQGSWRCVSWKSNGRENAERARGLESSYEGNQLTLWTQGQEYRHGLVTLDPSRTPKAMNTWDLDGPGADETNRGIYELDGDTLKVCIVLDRDKPRPTEFRSEPGSTCLLIVYERKKP